MLPCKMRVTSNQSKIYLASRFKESHDISMSPSASSSSVTSAHSPPSSSCSSSGVGLTPNASSWVINSTACSNSLSSGCSRFVWSYLTWAIFQFEFATNAPFDNSPSSREHLLQVLPSWVPRSCCWSLSLALPWGRNTTPLDTKLRRLDRPTP